MNHIEKIAARLADFGLDAMLITSESGERYALGFHGEGLLLVTRDGAQYTTDGRYIEAAQEQVEGAQVLLITPDKGHMAFAKEYIEGKHLHNVGFESGAVTVDAHKRYTQALPCVLTPAQDLLDGLRASKDEGELVRMRRAQAITYELLSRGGERVSFNPIVAVGSNGSRPHAVPGDQMVEEGMFITMDFGCKVEGYCSDMTRTVALGQPTEEMEAVYAAVLAAQKAGINAARAGVTGREIDAAARRVLQEAGYGEYFSHGFGHSLGVDIHEAPSASAKETRPMPAGAVISAEPGVYLPGRFGVRIEDVLILGETGCENITRSPKDLIVL